MAIQLVSNEKVINIMERALNHVDARLVDHGLRVSYLMYKVLSPQKMFNNTQLRDVCILAMLHDVGAYRTEEIDKMVVFETIDVWDHSINSYLYQKYFSPLKEIAPVLLFHHADTEEVKNLHPRHQLLAQLISLTDRADVYSLHGGTTEDFNSHAESYRDIKYSTLAVDMYLDAKIDIETIFDNMDSDEGFNEMLRNTPLSDKEAAGYAKMTAAFVDFRSSRTVAHTAAAEAAIVCLAKAQGKNDNQIEILRTKAILRGICKIGISFSVLDSFKPLTVKDERYTEISKDILMGNVADDIKKSVIEADDIISIVDAIGILCGSTASPSKSILAKVLKKIKTESAELALENLDDLLEEISKSSKPVLEAYSAINTEHRKLKHLIDAKDFAQVTEMAMEGVDLPMKTA